MPDTDTAKRVSVRLKDCPFCGSSPMDAPEVLRFVSLSDGFTRVRCPSCTAMGAVGRDKGDAAEEWNRRA